MPGTAGHGRWRDPPPGNTNGCAGASGALSSREPLLSCRLLLWEGWLGVEVTGKSPAIRFDGLIRTLSARGPVVILVDEYDKPLLGHLGQATATEIQGVLKNFYGVIKTTEDRQRFAMIT